MVCLHLNHNYFKYDAERKKLAWAENPFVTTTGPCCWFSAVKRRHDSPFLEARWLGSAVECCLTQLSAEKLVMQKQINVAGFDSVCQTCWWKNAMCVCGLQCPDIIRRKTSLDFTQRQDNFHITVRFYEISTCMWPSAKFEIQIDCKSVLRMRPHVWTKPT